jgi:ATP-dependent HslUV protease ATP-binding subunit HslU
VEAIERKAASDLTPKQIVEKLDAYIVGQHKAKKAVAIALRNRSRRMMLPEDIRDEIAPKNILLIGPTGVGKTEIARRLAKLCGAPFLKVEATKYTEVGYVGRDVESMIRDLAAVAFNMAKSEMQEGFRKTAEERVEEDLLDLLVPGSGEKDSGKRERPAQRPGGVKEFTFTLPFFGQPADKNAAPLNLPAPHDGAVLEPVVNTESGQERTGGPDSSAAGDGGLGEDAADAPQLRGRKKNLAALREKFRVMLREGKLEERTVEITVQKSNPIPVMEVFAGGNMEDMESMMQGIMSTMMGGRTKNKTVSVAEARKILTQEHLDRMVDPDKVSEEAKNRTEQAGIVFVDEIDKIAVRGEHGGQDVSREGVQRDILPIVEGSMVNTRYGVIDTTHILFIAAGAFNLAKPSDLIPELQGRFPLRVELDSLHAEDFKRILLEPKNALTRQYSALLSTEDVKLNWTPEAIDRMSSLAAEVNSKAENIGARRLHTIMETVLEELSFTADERRGDTIDITADYVDERLKNIIEDQDLSRYIL